MFGSEILEIAVGLAFVYLLLSLVVTAVTEMYSRLLALRSKNLYKGIQNLIGEFDVESPPGPDAEVLPGQPAVAGAAGKAKNADDFFDTPIIKSLTQPLKPKVGWLYKALAVRPRPGYISSQRFFQGLIQTFGEAEQKIESVGDIQTMIDRLPNGDLKTNLTTILKSAGNEVEKFEAGVRDWFDDSMDRVTGWFKRQAHTITVVIAFAVTIIFNASTITVAEVLWNDDARRAAVAKLATDSIDDGFGEIAERTGPAEKGEGEVGASVGPAGNEVVSARDAIEQGRMAAEIINETSALPLGWRSENPFHRDKINEITKTKVPGWGLTTWASHLLGWTLTAFALTLGAPFWFDTLKKLVNLRTSGVKPESGIKK